MIEREWVVREHYSDLLIGENVDGGYLIATLPTGHCHPAFVASQRKNAQVMAAAPDLLDALKDALCALECCGKDYDYVAGKARAAIEKATGQ